MKFTGYITVKLSSKRVPNKSIIKFGDKSLIDIALEKITTVQKIENTILYCSDEKILDYINPNMNFTFIKRNKRLDNDNVTFNQILDSLVDELDTDYIVFLSCTSPFIKKETIEEVINTLERDNRYDSAFTAVRYHSFAWYKNSSLNYDIINTPRTQDIEPVDLEASSFYVFKKDMYIKTGRRIGFTPYIKYIDKIEGIDIDTTNDLYIAKSIFNYKNSNNIKENI